MKKTDLMIGDWVKHANGNTGMVSKMKEEVTNWGRIFYFTYTDCRFALYIYNDDNGTIYLSNVFVNQNKRGNGIGNKILDKAFKESIKIGASYICLKCKSDSWVHDWYYRKGFNDVCIDNDESKYNWMVKKVA